MTSAEKCRRNGWKVGTQLVGDEGYGPDVIELTAIGRTEILAVQISGNGEDFGAAYENLWDLDCRKWRKVKPEAKR